MLLAFSCSGRLLPAPSTKESEPPTPPRPLAQRFLAVLLGFSPHASQKINSSVPHSFCAFRTEDGLARSNAANSLPLSDGFSNMQAPGFSTTAISSTPHCRRADSPSDSELKTISHRHPDSKPVRALPLHFLCGHSANSTVNSAIRAGSSTHTDPHRSARRFKPKSVFGNLQPGKGTA